MSTTSTYMFWLTCINDRRDHAVTDTEMESGCLAGQGEFRAVGDRTIRVGSLNDPFQPPCRDCLQVVEAVRERKKRRPVARPNGVTRSRMLGLSCH